MRDNQDGFAAIVIAIVLIIVLSLTTVGFADLMRHEQQSALDRQLSNQAYYAAESGVNAAAKAVESGYNTQKKTCGTDTSPSANGYLSDFHVGADDSGTTITCLLIDPNPASIVNDAVGTAQAAVYELQTIDSSGTQQPISSITISWQNSREGAGPDNFTGDDCREFPTQTNWTNTGMLRIQLVPLSSLKRADLVNNSLNAFLCPGTSKVNNPMDYGSTTGFANNRNGQIISGGCKDTNTPLKCSVTISGLAGNNQSTYFVALRSIYKQTQIRITADGASAGTKLYFRGAQAVIDSTGKSQGVLRRIRVVRPIHNTNGDPTMSAGVDSICKQIKVLPNNGTTANACN